MDMDLRMCVCVKTGLFEFGSLVSRPASVKTKH